MAKELYLYSPIYDFVAQALIQQMEENKSESLVLRINSPGGQVFAGWGIVSKMKELVNAGIKIHAKCDGIVASMAVPILCYASSSECDDISVFMIHKAGMYVSNDDDQQLLDKVNDDLRKKLNKKVDNKKLKDLKGVTIDDIFDAEDRKEYYLTAKEAKDIGLVDKITKLNPSELMAAFNENIYKIAAIETAKPPISTPTSKPMTLEQLKAEHSDLFKSIFDLGVKGEQNRIKAWMAWGQIDPEKVSKAIADGTEITMADISEFSAKAMTPEALKKLSAEAAKPISTEEPEVKPAITSEDTHDIRGNKLNLDKTETKFLQDVSAILKLKNPIVPIAQA